MSTSCVVALAAHRNGTRCHRSRLRTVAGSQGPSGQDVILPNGRSRSLGTVRTTPPEAPPGGPPGRGGQPRPDALASGRQDRGGQPGRRRATSQAELEQVAFELFAANGFEQTTVEDIAAAAGIGRRTFFRYFPSKNDVPWGMFDLELERMRARLKACPRDVQLMDAIRVALVDFNQVEPGQIPRHRRRMELILRVPALLAHSTLRFADWRDVIAEFVAERTGQRPDSLAPQAIAYAVLGVAVAAYEQWLDDENAELGVLLDSAMRQLAGAFAGSTP
jgi:TetR/AcrR family transcriptional regulator, regulator of mycofactocin system